MRERTRRYIAWLVILLFSIGLFISLTEPFPTHQSALYYISRLLHPIAGILFAIALLLGFEGKTAKILVLFAIPLILISVVVSIFSAAIR